MRKFLALLLKTILFFLFILSSFRAYTQNKTIDSLKKVLQTQKEDTNKVNILNALSKSLWEYGDYKNDMQYAVQAFTLSKKINFKKGRATAFNNIGNAYANQLKYKEAFKNCYDGLKLMEEIGDKRGMAQSYSNIGRTYAFQFNYPEALKNFYTALKIQEEIKYKSGIANSLQIIGGLYFSQGNNPEALKNIFAALRVRKEIGDKFGVAQSYNGIGEIYFSEHNYPEALKMFFIALKIFKEPGAPNWGIPWAQSCIGDIYKRQGDSAYIAGDKSTSAGKYTEALKNYLASLKIEKEINSKNGLASTYVNLGSIYIKLTQFSEAKNYFKKALQLSAPLRLKEAISECYLGLSNLDSVEGNYKQAFGHYKMYIIYRDSLINEESTKKSLQAKMQYEFDKKEAFAKTAQNKKDALIIAEIKNQKIIRNFSYAGTVVVLIFGSYSFYRYRRRKRLQSRQEMSDERLRISRELHDDIGSTLGSISIYSEVAKNRTEKSENANEVLSKIGVASRELIEKMSDIVWSLNPENESFEQLQNRMQAFSAMILTPRNIVYDFKTDEEIKKIQLTSGQRKNVFLIFKEAIHNIVKYADCKKVIISFAVQKDNLMMMIKDDGKGFETRPVLSNAEAVKGESLGGNGIKNMQARADDMNARFNISTKINEGTKIELILKL
jgi:signal transduction histidine kinase